VDSDDAHRNQLMQLLADPKRAAGFAKMIFDLLTSSQ
jgi:type I restriction enzyme, R subunit